TPRKMRSATARSRSRRSALASPRSSNHASAKPTASPVDPSRQKPNLLAALAAWRPLRSPKKSVSRVEIWEPAHIGDGRVRQWWTVCFIDAQAVSGATFPAVRAPFFAPRGARARGLHVTQHHQHRGARRRADAVPVRLHGDALRLLLPALRR